jgi:hypothetical protein
VPIDFLFIDGAHDFEINKATWDALEPQLAPDAVVVVHDTGLWVPAVSPPEFGHWGVSGVVSWEGLADTEVHGRYHQLHEVQFVNWITATYPQWAKLDFMSRNTFRHGFTVLQRRRIDRVA